MDTTLFSRRDVGHVRAQALSKKFEEENVFAASPLGIQSNEVNAKEYIKELLSKELKITQVKKSEAQIDDKQNVQEDATDYIPNLHNPAEDLEESDFYNANPFKDAIAKLAILSKQSDIPVP